MRIALKQSVAAVPITGIIPFLLLATVPLAYEIGLPCLAVLLFLLTFLAFDTLFGWETEVRPATGKSGLRALLARLPIWTYIPVQLGVILWGAAMASREPGIAAPIGLALATGAAAGIFGMLAAHEMIHSRSSTERALGLAMLAGVGYMHFRISHLHGHHSFAGTYEDPATARRGEGAYRFILRSITGQIGEAWRFERRRTAGRRRPWLANRMVHYAAIVAAVDLGVLLAFGPAGLAFQLLQAAVAIMILELFNYIAHYGLARRRNAAGRLEPFGAIHSWNALPRFNNWALFNGGHHTAHHRRPAEPYQHLRLDPAAPELPFGFAGSILLAMVPPLWRRVMDPRVDYWRTRPAA